MNKKRQQQLWLIGLIGVIIALVVACVLYALRQNISLFYAPQDIARGKAPLHHTIRVGGMVVKGSIVHAKNDLGVRFKLTDYQHTIVVSYQGILPDLFREGQGIVAQGELQDTKRFNASLVLAKHDENYMPPEIRSMNLSRK